MRFTTIWTIPAMTVTERLRQTVDLAAQKVARHLPQRIRFWTYIQVGSAAIRPDEEVPAVRFTDLLGRVPGGPR